MLKALFAINVANFLTLQVSRFASINANVECNSACIVPYHCQYNACLFRQMGRRKSLFDSTVQTAMQQHVVEHAEHNKAQKKSTAPGSDSRRLDLCLASGHSQLRKRE